MSNFQVGLGSILCHVLSEPEFYGGLMCGLGRIVGSNNFSAQFVGVITHYKKIGLWH